MLKRLVLRELLASGCKCVGSVAPDGLVLAASAGFLDAACSLLAHSALFWMGLVSSSSAFCQA